MNTELETKGDALTNGTFSDIVRNMSAHDIIMAMVEGLKNPKTQVDMGTFGTFRNDVCYGCAATNCIINISKISIWDFKHFLGDIETLRGKNKPYDSKFIGKFEDAIDRLRRGDIDGYNYHARLIEISLIKNECNISTPYLDDSYTGEDLMQYEKLAKAQL